MFFKTDKVFDVINVCCCCCCLILLFVSTRFLNIGISQQSNASIFTPLSCLLWSLSYRSYTIFLKNTSAFLGFPKNNFWVFLSVLHLVDNYAKIVDARGRNLMCHRTLPSRLVLPYSHFLRLENERRDLSYHSVAKLSLSTRSKFSIVRKKVQVINPLSSFFQWHCFCVLRNTNSKKYKLVIGFVSAQ